MNSGKEVSQRSVKPRIVSEPLNARFVSLTGRAAQEFVFLTRLFEFELRKSDEVILQESAENGFPLIVLRGGEVIVNFDILATQRFEWEDSKRPIYTHIPGFNIQRIPPVVRRPLSNLLQANHWLGDSDVIEKYRQLPLTGFEFVVLLLKFDCNGKP